MALAGGAEGVAFTNAKQPSWRSKGRLAIKIKGVLVSLGRKTCLSSYAFNSHNHPEKRHPFHSAHSSVQTQAYLQLY
jgi:hypothetical protein